MLVNLNGILSPLSVTLDFIFVYFIAPTLTPPPKHDTDLSIQKMMVKIIAHDINNTLYGIKIFSMDDFIIVCF